MSTAPKSIGQLQRVRWAVRGVLVLGVAASITANVLHAEPNGISQVIAGWPPAALLVTIELVARVPVHRTWLANIRRAGTTVIAGIAAWVSYWHMAGVASRYGEHGASPYLLPLSVDGLVVIASVSLVELSGRLRDVTELAADEPILAAEEPALDVPEPVVDGMPFDVSPEPHPTAVKIAALRKRHPRITQQKVAERLDLAVRTVARHWGDSTPPAPVPMAPVVVEEINGHKPEFAHLLRTTD